MYPHRLESKVRRIHADIRSAGASVPLATVTVESMWLEGFLVVRLRLHEDSRGRAGFSNDSITVGREGETPANQRSPGEDPISSALGRDGAWNRPEIGSWAMQAYLAGSSRVMKEQREQARPCHLCFGLAIAQHSNVVHGVSGGDRYCQGLGGTQVDPPRCKSACLRMHLI